MAFAAGAFFVWALMSNHPAGTTEPSSIEWPAWVQAVGSIAAIFVAVAVPGWQRSQQRKDEREKAAREARSMALALLDATTQFRDASESYERDLAAACASYNDGLQKLLPMPSDLEDVKRELHLMGEPGDRILRALYYAGLLKRMEDDRGILWREHYPDARNTVALVLSEINAGLDGMNDLLK
ncbi:hypothetical protein [Stenotrophomonas lactitubi]|uniref:hypothetical protein n=1 Tax=Stenotrophomonas lactitubi TaxID=2045214 RepID=UPI00289D2077|nr:hypothetical protein [Stenotrophomonas lactitubi]